MSSVALPAGWSGIPAVAAGVPARLRQTGHLKLIGMLIAGLVVAGAAVSGISSLLTPSAKLVVCPPSCGHPPTGTPIDTSPRYTAPDGSFSVNYVPSGRFYTATTSASGVTDTSADGKGVIHLYGIRATSASAAQTVASLISADFPGAHRAYVLPNAVLGYQAAYGEVDDYYPQTTNSAYAHERVIVVAAVKNGEMLIAAGIGPYDAFSADGLNNGHPSGADLKVALDLDPLVNSFTWRGDPPR